MKIFAFMVALSIAAAGLAATQGKHAIGDAKPSAQEATTASWTSYTPKQQAVQVATVQPAYTYQAPQATRLLKTW